jgi:hypothetical protein
MYVIIVSLLSCKKYLRIIFRDTVLSFDAMAISPSTRFSIKEDHVIGLDESGNGMANLFLVFMLRGTNSNWKQPIGYFLVSHNVKAEVLYDLIIQTIKRVHETELRVSHILFSPLKIYALFHYC